MPILALVLLFFSASMHALWNFLLKSAEEKYVAMGWQTILSGILALVVMVFYSGLPPRDMWLFAIISMLLEAIYFILLCIAYSDHDFSLVYPIARGAAPALRGGAGAPGPRPRLAPGPREAGAPGARAAADAGGPRGALRGAQLCPVVLVDPADAAEGTRRARGTRLGRHAGRTPGDHAGPVAIGCASSSRGPRAQGASSISRQGRHHMQRAPSRSRRRAPKAAPTCRAHPSSRVGGSKPRAHFTFRRRALHFSTRKRLVWALKA